MTTQDLIQEILQKNPLTTQEQILEKLAAERTRTGGLLGDETLLRLIAAKFGVQVQQNTIQNCGVLSTSRLFAGLYDVTVAGRLVAVFPAKTFQGAEKSGKFATLMLADKEGLLRVVLWNEKAELVEKGELKAGQTVRLVHGYTRQDKYGKTELHLGTKSQVEFEPANKEEYLTIEKFTAKINTLNINSGNVHLSGEVKEVLGESSFIRTDTSVGTVTRLTLADDSGQVTVVFWNEKATELEIALKANARLLLVNARVKEGQNGGLEVHVDSNTFIDVQAAQTKFTKVACLVEDQIVNFEGIVCDVRENKEVTTSKGETVKLSVFDLKEEGGGTVRVSAWRTHAEALKDLKVGDKLRLENVYVKKGFGGKIELSTRTATVAVVTKN